MTHDSCGVHVKLENTKHRHQSQVFVNIPSDFIDTSQFSIDILNSKQIWWLMKKSVFYSTDFRQHEISQIPRVLPFHKKCLSSGWKVIGVRP